MPTPRLCRHGGGPVARALIRAAFGRARLAAVIGIVTGPQGRRASCRGPVTAGLGACGGGKCQGSFLDIDIGVDVGVGGPDAGMTEPQRDHGGVDAGLQQ